MQTRREMIRQLAFSVGGAAALLAFDSDESVANTETGKTEKARFYRPSEWALVTFLSDATIPRTDTPGALDVGVPALMDHLYQTWASTSSQAQHRSQLGHIERQIESYVGLQTDLRQPARRLRALSSMDATAFEKSNLTAPEWADYRAVKTLIVQSYYATEVGATQERHYVPVPGRWIASAPLADIPKAW